MRERSWRPFSTSLLVLPDFGDDDVDKYRHERVADDKDHCEIHVALPSRSIL